MLTLEQLATSARHPDEPIELARAKEFIVQAETQPDVPVPLQRPLSDVWRHPFRDTDEWRVSSKGTLYDEAEELLQPFVDRTVSYEGTDFPSQHSNDAKFLTSYIQYKRQIIDGNLEGALKTLSETIASLQAPGSEMSHRKELIASLIIEQANVFKDAGLYGLATTTSDELTTLVSNGEREFLLGELAFNMGDYVTAGTSFENAYDINPRRKGVVDKLTVVYNTLAEITPDPSKDYSSAANPVLGQRLKDAKSKFFGGHVAEAKAMYEEVRDGLTDTANDAEKALKARALHGLAMVSRMGRDYESAIELLRKSISIMPTPAAYQNLAEVHVKMR